MSDLKKNIDRYMDIKSIKYYSDLLIMIGKELKVKDPYEFASREKSNFSKMLKDERPLKHEYIIPLEKIFGVSMARLTEDGAYKFPLDKEDMPFIKGFRYYAYKDDPKLYEDDFERTMVTNDGYPTICNSDEFNKTFLDYVVEYRSVNALRFLVKKHGFKAAPLSRNSYLIDGNCSLFTSFDDQLMKMAIQEDDPELFAVTFNPYDTCVHMRIDPENLRIDSQVFELLLESEKVFNSLFETKTFPLPEFNYGVVGCKDQTIELLNPLLNVCLDYALSNLDQYRDQARKIIEFGIQYNQKALDIEGIEKNRLSAGEYGSVYYGGRELVASIVCPKHETDDSEMLSLIQQMETVRKVDY